MEGKKPKVLKYDMLIEAITWIVVIVIIFGVRFLPEKLIAEDQAYLLIGGIVAFALFYYLVVYKFFQRTQRFYFKIIADVVLIGILIHVVKDYGQYFFALYFLPIAAAALSLEFINALLIAVIAAVFVVFEIFLGSQNLLPQSQQLYQGAWQIGLILLITIFCRALAVQLGQERTAKEESLAREKMLQEESSRNKEFLSLTSHQLFTSFSMIRGFSSMLTDNSYCKLSPKQQDAAQEIYKNTTRMVDLVTELLSISRIQAGSFEVKKSHVNINKLICDVVGQFNKTNFKKDVKIVYKSKGLY